MNEILFFGHIAAVLLFLAIAVRSGQPALFAVVVLSNLLANLFVLKQIVLFGLHVTCSDVFTIGAILGLNLLQELYGKPAARQAILGSLLCLIFFACMSQIHLLYSPSPHDQTQAAYRSLLDPAPRIVAASLLVSYLVQRFDVVLFGFLKSRFHLGLRIAISLVCTQALDTILFTFIGLYGLVASLANVIAVSFAVKCAIIACSTPIASLLKRFARQPA